MIFSETTDISTVECNKFNSIGGVILVDGDNSDDPNSYSIFFENESNLESGYFSQNLLSTYRTCRLNSKRNVTACQALGNMCVLNMYRVQGINVCGSFNRIPKSTSKFLQYFLYFFYII